MKQLNVPMLIRTCSLLRSNPLFYRVQQNVCQNRTFHQTYTNSQEFKLTQIGQSTAAVKHYGRLFLDNSPVDLTIKPINLDVYPNMDVATSSFFSEDSSEKEFPIFSQTAEELSLLSSKVYEPLKNLCVVEIPLKYGNLLQFQKFSFYFH